MIFIDLYILYQLLLPTQLRLSHILAFGKVINEEIQSTQSSLQNLHDTVEYDLIFNGQTIYLEHYLNDQYDPVLRRIYIDDVDNDDTLFLFNQAELNEQNYVFNQTENEPPLYMINQSESVSAIDFEIFIPIDVVFTEVILRKQFDKYTLAGPNYEIVII